MSAVKKQKMFLLKMYFSDAIKVKRNENYFDHLPRECKDLVYEFVREDSFAKRIQRHWRKVRYSPGENPGFVTCRRQKCTVSHNGHTRESYRYIQQRVIMHWPGEWEGGFVSQGAHERVKYSAKLFGDSTSADTGRAIYYYDLEKRTERLNKRYKAGLAQIDQRKEQGLSIDGWSIERPGEFGGAPIVVPWEPLYVAVIKPW